VLLLLLLQLLLVKLLLLLQLLLVKLLLQPSLAHAAHLPSGSLLSSTSCDSTAPAAALQQQQTHRC
jgi:hypothetical protein